jgi:flagellin-like hook-associated protein FlgL
VGNQDADAYKLSIESVNYGDDQFVSVRSIVGGMQVKDDAGKVVERDYGQDIAGRLNGVTLVGDGLDVSMNTSTLDLSVSMKEDVKAGDEVGFTIKGGGASFQLGPDVVTNQQVRLGIQSVNTARLGGPSGRMYQLRSGSKADLSTNTKLADKIVQESIMNISTSRGLLGSLQRSTFDVNISALQNTLEALTSAESSISNADFAQESSNLSRSQILVQSGAKVLGIANQYPQYAAMLVG